MRIPGTRSSTAQTILQQGSQEDERRAARKRSRQQSQQQVQTGILATGNLLGDVARTIPQFQANSIRVDEGAKDRAFEEAMTLAKNKFVAGEGVLDRQARLKVAELTNKNPISQALAALLVDRTDKEITDIDNDPTIAPDVKQRVGLDLASGRVTPEVQKVRAQRATQAPIRQAAQGAGLTDPRLVASGEPGAYKNMTRDEALLLLGNAVINQGENSTVAREIAAKLGYALPQRTLPQKIGNFFTEGLQKSPVFGPLMDKSYATAEQEVEEFLRALATQEGPVATDRGYTSTKPFSAATRAAILRRSKNPVQ